MDTQRYAVCDESQLISGRADNSKDSVGNFDGRGGADSYAIRTKHTSSRSISILSGYHVCKRLFDIISASLLLIVITPLIPLIVIAIKADSPGSIIYIHKRIGYQGKEFNLLKFRTMYSNSKELFDMLTEEQKQEFKSNFKLHDDPRITRIGKFLRKTSLDELPQLVNIICGDLSVVGPRPIVGEELTKYGNHAKEFLSVKPGLTGKWAAYARSSCDYKERIEMELDYIRNASLVMDMKIVMKTVLTVLDTKRAA